VLEKQDLFRKEVEKKIKNEILDPILGINRAFVFADVQFDVITKKSREGKLMEGALQKYKEKGQQSKSPLDDYLLPGVPKPKSITQEEKPEIAQGTGSKQSKSADATRYGIETEINKFVVTVIHDETLAKDSLILARSRIDDFLSPYKVKGQSPPAVVFKPTKFKSYNIVEDIKRPSVYIPLIYALLSLLLLMFLFGPLWGFFRKYVRALLAKPGAEVNIESKTESGEGKEEGGGGGAQESKQEGHQDIDMNFTQAEIEEESEEDMMKNFKPFSYITEENIKKLVYLFLTRKEEPWVIAVILFYLNPELSKQVLNMLPVEIQSKVVLESLTVRQATFEQIKAIDKDIRESIDFIVGGIDEVTRILSEADLNTQKNILEYLKTQKPEIYDKVRKVILLFEDIVNFKNRDIQTIINSVNNEDIAKAIRKAEPPILDKFFHNMSQGAVKQVKEIMEYSRDVTDSQITDSQNKIVETAKALIAEGKIAPLHEQSQELYILDSVDMSGRKDKKNRYVTQEEKEEKKEKSEGGEAMSYFTTGAGLYNQGNYQDAVTYLREAVNLKPDMAEAHQYLGAAYYALGMVNESLSAYEKYVQYSNDPAAAEWLNGFKQQVTGGQ